MEIKIDLDDIFRDEDGNLEETLEESVRRQVMDRLTGDLRSRLFKRLDEELHSAMQAYIAAEMKERMPAIMDDILNTGYTPVSSYGKVGEPTTFKNEIIKSVAANMVYAPKSYSSEENAFTRAVKSILEKQTKEIQDAIVSQVDVKFKDDAIAFAVKKLSERLGLRK